MEERNFVLRGNICHCVTREKIETFPGHYLVCCQGRSAGIFPELPEQYQSLPLWDFAEDLIIPGLTDLHLHASQYGFAGTGMDMELLDWLDTRTFPEESRYEDLDYAEQAYEGFVRDLKKSLTTRACIFATLHVPASSLLMEKLEETGLVTFVGKVNMDRNSPEGLKEKGWKASVRATRIWLKDSAGRYQRVFPILTPRFVPSCSDRLLEALGELQKEYGLRVQSHLSENPGEIAWVKELCPWSASYGEVYEHFGLMGEEGAPAVMAHCVYSEESENELELLKKKPVYIAHCPQSNTNLASGIAPVRRYLDEGIKVGLGTDIAGGHRLSLFQTMAEAVQVSKLRWRLQDPSLAPLTIQEAFYLGTRGGGGFFGKTGSFARGYDFDALVLSDRRIRTAARLTLEERLERLIYLYEEQDLKAKFVQGRKIAI